MQDDGNTVLHLAAGMGDITVGRFLQSVKAKPNVCNNVRFVFIFGVYDVWKPFQNYQSFYYLFIFHDCQLICSHNSKCMTKTSAYPLDSDLIIIRSARAVSHVDYDFAIFNAFSCV